ncbi:MAG: amidohydrolase family protein [Acidimicrobiales bacterium]
MGENKLTVVDADSHVIEPVDLWTDRMDGKRWGNWIPRTDPTTGWHYVGGQARRAGLESLRRASAFSGVAVERIAENVDRTRHARTATDPAERLGHMDEAKIDAAVLYPGDALFFGPDDRIEALGNAEFVRDCQRAYNDWLSEYCSADPDRLFGVALVPLQDIGLAIGEAVRALDHGLRAVVVRPSPYIGELPLSHSIYDPFWSVCQELNMTVAFHSGVHSDTPGASRKFGLVVDDPDITVVQNTVSAIYAGAGLGHTVGGTVDTMVTMARLIMGGVCERYPGLRFLFLETGAGWLPSVLERLDRQVEELPLEGENLTMAPSAYFRRQCYVSSTGDEWNLAAAVRWLGSGHVMWASGDIDRDDPVPLAQRLGELDPAQRADVAGFSAVSAYGLPVGTTTRAVT